jgi:hypothetical protein
MLRSKRLVVAGAIAAGEASHAVARRALLDGAHVTLVAPPGRFARCRELAEGLPRIAHAVCADLAREEDVAALHEHLRCAYGTVDGALYAAAPDAGPQGAAFGALAFAVAPLLPPGGGSLVALAGPGEDGEPSALVATGRLLARELAAAGGRVNVVAGGRAGDGRAVDAACFLLGPAAQGVTGQVLHVDRRTSDRPVQPPAQALGRRMAGGRPPAHTVLTPSAFPAAPAPTDQRGASR